MLEVFQLVNEVQNAMQAIGGLNIVKSVPFIHYVGIPEQVIEQSHYTFHYTSGTNSLSGICETAVNGLHCQTQLFDGNTIKYVEDAVALTTNDVSKAVVTYCEEKIRQLHITIVPNVANSVQIINAFKTT